MNMNGFASTHGFIQFPSSSTSAIALFNPDNSLLAFYFMCVFKDAIKINKLYLII